MRTKSFRRDNTSRLGKMIKARWPIKMIVYYLLLKTAWWFGKADFHDEVELIRLEVRIDQGIDLSYADAARGHELYLAFVKMAETTTQLHQEQMEQARLAAVKLQADTIDEMLATIMTDDAASIGAQVAQTTQAMRALTDAYKTKE